MSETLSVTNIDSFPCQGCGRMTRTFFISNHGYLCWTCANTPAAPAAEIATLRARAAELEASRARLATVIRLYDAAGEAATKRKAAGPAAHDYMGLTFEFDAAMARASDARRALTESDLAPETPHG